MNVDLDQELIAHGAKESFDLASAFGSARAGVNEADAEHRARPQQRRGHESTAVVDVDRLRDPASSERMTKRCLEPHDVFGQTPAEPGHSA